MKTNTFEYLELVSAPIDTVFSYFWDANADRSFALYQRQIIALNKSSLYTSRDYLDYLALYCGMPL